MIRVKEIINDETRESYTYVRLYMIIDDLISSIEENVDLIGNVSDIEMEFLDNIKPLIYDMFDNSLNYNEKVKSLDKITKLIENICIHYYFYVPTTIDEELLLIEECKWSEDYKSYTAINIAGKLTGDIIKACVKPNNVLRKELKKNV